MDDSIITVKSIARIIEKMRNGKIESFLEFRRLIESANLVALSNELNPDSIFAIYVAKRFIGDVLSNLAGDSSFGFPKDDSYLAQETCKLVIDTGEFMHEFLLSQEQDCQKGISHYTNAVKQYFHLLYIISQIAEETDLSSLDQYQPLKIGSL